MLLHVAVANAQTGDDTAARRLEANADALSLEAFRWHYEPAKIQLALARSDRAELRRLVDSPALGAPRLFAFEGAAALLDALVALGNHERIKSEAPQWVREGTYTAPFALRALGVARGDRRLLNEAAASFESMGLEWHCEETRKLVSVH